MFEAYKIGVRISVIDGTSAGLLKIVSQFAKANTEANKLLDTVQQLNSHLRRTTRLNNFDGIINGFRQARREAEGFAAATERANRAASSGPRGGGSRSSGTPADAYSGGGLVPSYRGSSNNAFYAMAMAGAFARPGQSAPSAGNLNGPGAPRALGYGGGGGGLGSISGGSESASGSPLGQFSRAGGGWAGWRGWGGGGGGSGGSGGAMGAVGGIFGGMALEGMARADLSLLRGPIEQARELQRAQANFAIYGLGDELNQNAFKFARSMNVIGTSVKDAVNFMSEAQGVFRESGLQGDKALEGAKLAAPVLAKIAFASESLDAETQSKMHTQSLGMLRFIEMRGGLKDAATFNAIADAGWKAMRSSGGNVNWEQMRQFMARGGVAAQGLSNTALFGEMEPIIGELKGSTAGFALRTAYNRLNGIIRIPNQVAHELVNSGIWDSKKIIFNDSGGIKAFVGNPLVGSELFSKSPFEFYEKIIKPMYARLGYTTTNQTARENALIFGSTGGSMFSLMDRQSAAIHRSVDAQAKTKGIDDSVKQQSSTLDGQLLEYRTQMNNLEANLGTAILPSLISGLKFLNPLLHDFSEWAKAHPIRIRVLLGAFAALGVAMAISGVVLAVRSAFSLLGMTLTANGGIGAALSGASVGLSKLSAAASALAIGWGIGTYLSNKMDGTKAGDYFGHYATRAVGTVMGWFGDKDNDYLKYSQTDGFAQKYGGSSPYVSGSAAGKTVQVNSTVNLDGRQIANVVTNHQVKAATAPQTGMSGFDSSQFAAPIGLNGYP